MSVSISYLDDGPAVLSVSPDAFGEEDDVRTASTLEEDPRAPAERPADIVISDQSLPEITGTESLAEVARD